MLGECSSTTIPLSCTVTLRGFTAHVDCPMTITLHVLKDSDLRQTKEIRVSPEATSYAVNESFVLEIETGLDEASHKLCEEKVRIEAVSVSKLAGRHPLSFVEFDIASYMNVKHESTGLFTGDFDIREARIALENGSCLMLDLNVCIRPRNKPAHKEMDYLKVQEDDLFQTVRIPSKASTTHNRSFVSSVSEQEVSFESRHESQEEIEVVDEEGLENMNKRELIARIKELKNQNEELRLALSKTNVIKAQNSKIESMENLIVVLKSDMATLLNAIQKTGNHHIFDEIKDKVSFFS